MREQKIDPENRGGRERLLAAARDLFRRHGASNVGINDVTDYAGVARMTLYNNFASKEALTLAVYQQMVDEVLRGLKDMETAGRSEETRILDLFSHFDKDTKGPDYRGCPFIHASLQDSESNGPIYKLVHSYKRALRRHILTLLDDSRTDRAYLADLILVLLDGVVTESYLKGVGRPASCAKRAIATLLKSKSRLGLLG